MKDLRKVFLSLAIIGAATQLYAQPAGPVSVSSKLSVGDMTQRATELEAQVRLDDRHVQHLQAIARRDKDVIKLSCVNDKYVQLKAEANVFDGRKRDLLAVLDKDNRTEAFDAMSASAANVRKAREEAERCLGEPELGEKSENSYTSPQIPDDPTTGTPFPEPGTIVEPPVYASPYS